MTTSWRHSVEEDGVVTEVGGAVIFIIIAVVIGQVVADGGGEVEIV
jgi:hypothetical protein